MDCPRCTTALREGRYRGIEVCLCERCTGSLFRRRHLGAALERLSHELAGRVSLDALLPGVPDERSPIDCPACRAPMERYGYLGDRRVMIDGCARCERLWLDADELGAMARLHAQLDRRRERRALSATAPADVVGTHMVTQAVQQALLIGFVLG